MNVSSGRELLDISSLLSRIGGLVIRLPAESNLIPATTPLPQLRSLIATLTDADVEYVLKNAPLLSELRWMRVARNPDFLPLASTTLIKLNILSVGFSATQFISLLQHLPSLSHLTCGVVPRDVHLYTPLPFPNLRSLRLRQDYAFTVPSVDALALVTLPQLRCLEYDSAPNPAVIESFLSRSHCAICELETYIVNTTGTIALREEFELLPSVETLGVSIDASISIATLKTLENFGTFRQFGSAFSLFPEF
ncbi:hypothetical protein B0H14DRAFT_3461143 [Mycena olivaceomarginata]|nr:hypothetical protein B0H14DRAFT_3461143 [Mycena olivaceomarginata]